MTRKKSQVNVTFSVTVQSRLSLTTEIGVEEEEKGGEAYKNGEIGQPRNRAQLTDVAVERKQDLNRHLQQHCWGNKNI